MGVLDRFKDVMSSNINALLDRAENPEKMIDQYLRNAKKDLADVRRETAGVMAEEKRAKQKVDEINKEIDELTSFAKRALQAGNREDAAQFVSRKQKLEGSLQDHISVYEASAVNANQMREMHNKLVEDVANMENRKNILKGKAAATRARETVNKMGANSAKHGATIGKMASMEERIDQKFNQAMSESELLNESVDGTDDLMRKYKSGTSGSVDTELDSLEIELGLKTAESVEDELRKIEEDIK